MRGLGKALMLAAALGWLAGCATHEETGTIAGGAAGAVIGERVGGTTGTLLGAIGGALLGREAGRWFDERDRAEMADALETRETGEETAWVNPDTGRRYQVTPQETFDRDGRPCREFVMEVEGEDEPVEGLACREDDGNWRIVG